MSSLLLLRPKLDPVARPPPLTRHQQALLSDLCKRLEAGALCSMPNLTWEQALPPRAWRTQTLVPCAPLSALHNGCHVCLSGLSRQNTVKWNTLAKVGLSALKMLSVQLDLRVRELKKTSTGCSSPYLSLYCESKVLNLKCSDLTPPTES